MRTLYFDLGQQYPVLPPAFIPDFTPEKLLPDKNLWLCVEPDGRFVVKHNQTREVPDLSETDGLVFRYLCFLHLCRCIRTSEETMSIEITDFSHRLDESVDFTALLHRGEAICGQKINLL